MIYTWLLRKYPLPKPLHIQDEFYHNEMRNAYHSSDAMDSFADQINSYDPSLVIDAGCGKNIWKGKINNLVGFDQYEYDTADYQMDYHEYDDAHNPKNADFVFCLGSVHNLEDINNPKQCIHDKVQLVHKWLKPGGTAIMRVRSDVEEIYQLNHKTPHRPNLYSWSINDIREWTQEFDFNIVKPIELRQVLLGNIADTELYKFREKFALHTDVASTIEKEIHRRENNLPVIVPIVMKAWYIWWWQKKA